MAICKYGKYKDGGVLTRKPKRCQEICAENVRIDVPCPHTCQYVFCLVMKREFVQSDTYLLPFLNKTLIPFVQSIPLDLFPLFTCYKVKRRLS